MATDSQSQASNPYQPPLEALPARELPSRELNFDWPTFLGWPFAMAINLVIPMIIAWDITTNSGRMGMWLAISIFLMSGWALCLVSRASARRLVVGSVELAFTQFFPVIQLFSGMLGFFIVNMLTLSTFPESLRDEQSNAAIFIVTSIVGACLASVAYVLGVTIFAVVQAWRGRTNRPSPTPIDYFQTPSQQTKADEK